jgi:hypothetical protein
MTAAALPRAAGSPAIHQAAACSPPVPYPQGTRPPRERYEPYLPDDKAIWFQLAVPSIQLRRLAAHFRARRL